MEDALRRYFEHFGENYPLMISETKSNEEIINDINRCISQNQKAKEPEYEDGCDY